MTSESKIKDPKLLLEALRSLLLGRKAHTQDEICSELELQGFEINQTKVSRLLRKIGAVKVLNEQGQIVYSFAREPAPPTLATPLRDLVIDIACNEMIVVIYTSPGSASMVARLLDYNQPATEILGTIAGDDTIFVTPKTTQNTHILFQEIKRLLRD